ncbi:MAG: CPBP family intramembrane metalloprotease [Deltaproteobacteria bacterium]|nr:CPBP family intramembrane metalloprotease [Deltaproteobacteria bacterium]
MDTAKIEIKTVLLSILSVALVEAAVRGAVLPLSGEYTFKMISIGAARCVEVTFIFLIMSRWGGGLVSIGLDKNTLGAGFIKGLMWSAGFGLLALLGFLIMRLAGLSLLSLIKTDIPSRPREVTLYLLVGGLLAPLAEEVFFRGLIYGFLRRWGIIIACLVSVTLFVLAHSIGGGIPVPQIVGGIIFALAYELEDNLMVPILIHTSGNIAIFGLSLL